MTERVTWPAPTNLLLATDLRPTCDRAFDRAILLAREWNAELTVLHVVKVDEHEVGGASRGATQAAAELERFVELPLAAPSLRIARRIAIGDSASNILALALETEASLIITGLAQPKSMSERFLGSTAERLVREAEVPVLSVRRRANGPYRSIAVAVAPSAPSRQALDLTLALFPHGRISTVHGYNLGFKGEAKPHSPIGEYEARVRQEIGAMVQSALTALPHGGGSLAGPVQMHFEQEDPEEVMRNVVAAEGIDLAVVGTHGRTGVARALVGSVAGRLLETLPCDVLAVKPRD